MADQVEHCTEMGINAVLMKPAAEMTGEEKCCDFVLGVSVVVLVLSLN